MGRIHLIVRPNTGEVKYYSMATEGDVCRDGDLSDDRGLWTRQAIKDFVELATADQTL